MVARRLSDMFERKTMRPKEKGHKQGVCGPSGPGIRRSRGVSVSGSGTW